MGTWDKAPEQRAPAGSTGGVAGPLPFNQFPTPQLVASAQTPLRSGNAGNGRASQFHAQHSVHSIRGEPSDEAVLLFCQYAYIASRAISVIVSSLRGSSVSPEAASQIDQYGVPLSIELFAKNTFG